MLGFSLKFRHCVMAVDRKKTGASTMMAIGAGDTRYLKYTYRPREQMSKLSLGSRRALVLLPRIESSGARHYCSYSISSRMSPWRRTSAPSTLR